MTITYNQTEFLSLLKDLLSSDDEWSYTFSTVEGSCTLKFVGINRIKVLKETKSWIDARLK
ncbi:hypothetical protein LCGC14_1565120 [marine sediment metagenome]|uniref:Uncharacterized protein n=1 Tax=marine sediment metagenome TaxID=412755 RepID=A0A0F9L298_9ZZZZ